MATNQMHLTDEQFECVLSSVSELTMVPKAALRFTWEEVLRLVKNNVPGPIVECGTWRGGCSFGSALIQKQIFGEVRIPVYLLDSFQGLPQAQERDGEKAVAYQKNTSSPVYFDNCRADLEDVMASRAKLGLTEQECKIVPGWFSETLNGLKEILLDSGISMLRIDCDWYEPVRLVLEELEPIVDRDGVVVIDDYYVWDGCTRAVHDYLSRQDEPYRIRSISNFTSAYFYKHTNWVKSVP